MDHMPSSKSEPGSTKTVKMKSETANDDLKLEIILYIVTYMHLFANNHSKVAEKRKILEKATGL